MASDAMDDEKKALRIVRNLRILTFLNAKNKSKKEQAMEGLILEIEGCPDKIWTEWTYIT